MSGMVRLALIHLRASWLVLFGPASVLVILVVATADGVRDLYPTAAERAMYAATIGASPAGWALNGRAVDLGNLGGIAANEVGFIGQLAVPLLGVWLGAAFTRGIEERGLVELVTSGRVSRGAVPGAAVAVGLLAWSFFAGLTVAGLVGAGFDAAGSARYAAILALYGVAFLGVGVLAGQVAQSMGGAMICSGVVVATGYLVRLYVDARQLDETWVSPMGWLSEAHPWGTWVWWPALSYLAIATITVGFALAAARRRDLGSGIIPQRRGPATAAPGLATPVGVAWHLTRAATITWALCAVAWCGCLGAMSQEIEHTIAENPQLSEFLGGDGGQVDTMMSLVVAAVLAAAAGVGVLTRCAAEESAARTGLVLAGSVTRARVWAAWSALAVVSAEATLFVAGAVLGLAQQMSQGTGDLLWDDLRAALGYAPAVLALVAISGLLVGFDPRTRLAAWVPISWALIVGLLGTALDLPRWSEDLSPLQLVGRLPIDSVDRTAWVALVAASAVGLLLGAMRFVRRDLIRG